jgi:hypothetical protein
VAAWFLGAVIGHGLLLMPLYSLADSSATAAIRHRDPQLPSDAVDQLRPGARRTVRPAAARPGRGRHRHARRQRRRFRLVAARRSEPEPAPDCILPDPYPPGRSPDGYLPLDRALDQRDATGDTARYHRALEGIARREPRHRRLGAPRQLLPGPGSPGPDAAAGVPPAGERQRQSWLLTALGCYQTAVSVAELALPDPFGGFPAWGHLDNRPFLRALHGMALALWQLDRFEEAEQALEVLNMLWLNPADNQGARELLAAVRARTAWEDTAQ